MSSTTTSAPAASSTIAGGAGTAHGQQGISIVTFLTALVSALVIFGVQMFAFIALKNKLARI